jgi:hypothetical protein
MGGLEPRQIGAHPEIGGQTGRHRGPLTVCGAAGQKGRRFDTAEMAFFRIGWHSLPFVYRVLVLH